MSWTARVTALMCCICMMERVAPNQEAGWEVWVLVEVVLAV